MDSILGAGAYPPYAPAAGPTCLYIKSFVFVRSLKISSMSSYLLYILYVFAHRFHFGCE